MEILGDDEDGQAVESWSPPPPVFTPGTTGVRVPNRRSDDDGSGRRPGMPTGPPGAPAAVDLGEQSREAAWEQGWDTSSLRLPRTPGPDQVDGTGGPAAEHEPGKPDAATDGATARGTVSAAEDDAEPTLLGRLLSVVLGAEALGLSGVLVVVVVSVSTLPPLLAYSSPESTMRDQLEVFASVYGLGGLLAAALGVAGILRLRPPVHPLVRGCAGSAVVTGVTLVVVGAALALKAGAVVV